jgi:hypothetical protein
LAVGADVPFQDEQIPPGEEWYYEIDGRAHGPLTWSNLEDLLGRSGDTAAQVRIRKGADGEWTAFRSGSSKVGLPAVSAPGADAFVQSVGHRPLPRAKGSGFSAFFQGHRDIAAAAGVWILLNVLFLLYWPEPYARERRYLATLQSVVAEADQLRASGASDKEWQDLRKRAKDGLAPMIGDLQKSASSAELPRQQLLWCARDLAPKIMGPQTKEREENERRLKQYLESVNGAISGH